MVIQFAEIGAGLWVGGGPRSVTYGAVAEAAGCRKSLVSHHYRSHRALLLASGDLVATMAIDEIRALLSGLQAIAPSGRDPNEALARLVERLFADDARWATCILEIAALAVADPDFHRILGRILQAIDAVILLVAPGEQQLLRAVLLGEMLVHAPLPASPVTLLGLRGRLAWFRDPPPENAQFVKGLAELVSNPALYPYPSKPVAIPAQEEDRRTRILHAAVRLLARGENPSHRSIAAEALLPLAATTYYFKSRIGILENVYEAIVNAAELRALSIDRLAGDGSERLLQLIGGMLPFYISAEAGATVAHLNLALIAARSPELRDWAAKAHEAEIRSIEAYLETPSRSTCNVAQAVLAAVTGCVLLNLHNGRAGEMEAKL